MRILAIMTLALAIFPQATLAQVGDTPVLRSARFEQVALTVTDLEQARAFYRERLGLRLMFEANNMLFFDVGGTRLMIALDAEREASPNPTGILYFHVDDFGSALARLRLTTATLIGPVETVQATSDGMLQLQQFEDPDGNMLAIMGFVPL